MQLKPLFVLPIAVLTVVLIAVGLTTASNERDAAAVFEEESKARKALVDIGPVEGRPDFQNIADVQEKKVVFFEYMLPMIREANASILVDREKVESFSSKLAAGAALRAADSATLNSLFEKYRMTVDGTPAAADIKELLARTDVVPASLVLAQSANESGWGTSRFAVSANNFLGCGVLVQAAVLHPNNVMMVQNMKLRSLTKLMKGSNTTSIPSIRMMPINTCARSAPACGKMTAT